MAVRRIGLANETAREAAPLGQKVRETDAPENIERNYSFCNIE